MAWDMAKREDKASQLNKSGWNVASEDLRGGGSPGSLADTQQFNRMAALPSAPSHPTEIEQKITIKRN